MKSTLLACALAALTATAAAAGEATTYIGYEISIVGPSGLETRSATAATGSATQTLTMQDAIVELTPPGKDDYAVLKLYEHDRADKLLMTTRVKRDVGETVRLAWGVCGGGQVTFYARKDGVLPKACPPARAQTAALSPERSPAAAMPGGSHL